MEITIEILRKKEDDLWLIDSILDKASDKGTGNWTTIATAELGVPSTMIVSALFTRFVSSYKNEREELSGIYKKSNISPEISGKEILQAYQLSRIINHHQGFELLQKASETYDWNLNLSEIARIWTNGCIIRSSLMEKLVDVLYESHNILLNKEIIDQVKGYRTSLTTVVSQCILAQLEITSLSEAANYLNGHTTSRSSANIIQAQRDYFGAHTYQRINDPSGKFYHTNWKNITNDLI